MLPFTLQAEPSPVQEYPQTLHLPVRIFGISRKKLLSRKKDQHLCRTTFHRRFFSNDSYTVHPFLCRASQVMVPGLDKRGGSKCNINWTGASSPECFSPPCSPLPPRSALPAAPSSLVTLQGVRVCCMWKHKHNKPAGE